MMSEAEERLDKLFDEAFSANHPAMLDYVALKFEMKAKDSALAALKAENERLKAVLHGAGYQNIDNLKNESVDKCTLLGLTAKLITEREIRARVDMTDEAARLRESLAAAEARLEKVREFREKWRGCSDEKRAERDCAAWELIKQILEGK